MTPFLAAADIGIAMGGVGSDTALQAADVVVMKGDPLAVPLGMMLSQATERIIVQNIVLILGVKFWSWCWVFWGWRGCGPP
ncbi:MAG: hypothetical protein ACLSUW_01530 [Akkermansia sp.]